MGDTDASKAAAVPATKSTTRPRHLPTIVLRDLRFEQRQQRLRSYYAAERNSVTKAEVTVGLDRDGGLSAYDPHEFVILDERPTAIARIYAHVAPESIKLVVQHRYPPECECR